MMSKTNKNRKSSSQQEEQRFLPRKTSSQQEEQRKALHDLALRAGKKLTCFYTFQGTIGWNALLRH